MKLNFKVNFILIFLLVFVNGAILNAQDLPSVKVISVERIFHNGEHNSFTDMCKFNDTYYVAFRSCPEGHMIFPSSSIIILSSKDGKDWKQVHKFNILMRDTRDPHFLIFKDKLFVYTGTWYCKERYCNSKERSTNQQLGYCVWTTDGTNWSEPEMNEGTYGHYTWRAAAFNDKAYLCARRMHEFAQVLPDDESRYYIESAMLESDDGIIWKKKALFQKFRGDETAFLFEDDGSLLAIARRDSNAQVLRSKPPYQEWTRTDLGCYLGGPLVVKWNDYYLVGGRKKENDVKKTALFWLKDDKLVECAELPSEGDNSYPGFVQISETRALVSYYSSHEKDDAGEPITAIYLATIEITK